MEVKQQGGAAAFIDAANQAAEDSMDMCARDREALLTRTSGWLRLALAERAAELDGKEDMVMGTGIMTGHRVVTAALGDVSGATVRCLAEILVEVLGTDMNRLMIAGEEMCKGLLTTLMIAAAKRDGEAGC